MTYQILFRYSNFLPNTKKWLKEHHQQISENPNSLVLSLSYRILCIFVESSKFFEKCQNPALNENGIFWKISWFSSLQFIISEVVNTNKRIFIKSWWKETKVDLRIYYKQNCIEIIFQKVMFWKNFGKLTPESPEKL